LKENLLVHKSSSCKSALALAAVIAGSSFVYADPIKEIKTEKGKPIPLGNFVSARPDCSLNPGPVPFPIAREKPYNGVVVMQIVTSDVAASGSCPARKIPSVALIYIPKQDFVGFDTVQFDLQTDDHQIQTLTYHINVQVPENVQAPEMK
jgi:hypothetical protein